MKQRLKAWGDTKIVPIVCVFIFNESGELLLLQRHTEDLGGGQWGTPGGRIEPDESTEVAICRELFEETGIKNLELTLLGAHYIHMPHGTVHMTSYRAVMPPGVGVVLDPEEHHGYAWLPLNSLLSKHNILWGIPTVLRDFRLLGGFDVDPTLADGSTVELLG